MTVEWTSGFDIGLEIFISQFYAKQAPEDLTGLLAQSYNDSCVLTNFSELVRLFEINMNRFPFPVEQNARVPLIKHPTISRLDF